MVPKIKCRDGHSEPPRSQWDYFYNFREDIIKTLPLRRLKVKAGMSFQVRDLRSAALELPLKDKDLDYFKV